MITNNKPERNTSQKEIILNYLKNASSHPSAERVYLGVRNRLPRISRGTVYRNLKNLKDKGKVLEIPTDVSRYDGNISNHAHFICQGCGRIFDLFDFCDDCKIIKNKRTKVGKINKYQIYFYGQCSKCQPVGRQDENGKN